MSGQTPDHYAPMMKNARQGPGQGRGYGRPMQHRPGGWHDSDYGTDELSSDTLSKMPKSVLQVARRGGVKSRRSKGVRSKEHHLSCGSSSEASSSGEGSAAPWLKIEGVNDISKVTLNEEVSSFGRFMSLTEDEKATRNMLRSSLQEIAHWAWPSATVKVYGSFAYGLSLPTSDLDMVIEDCQAPLQESFQAFLMHLAQNGYEILGTLDGSDTGAFVKTKNLKSSLVGNITITTGKSPVRSSVSVIKQQLQRYPSAASVVMAIRTVLSQCNLNDVPSGGLSSFSVIVMVLHLCQLRDNGDGCEILPGDLLKDFLRFYGMEFDFMNRSVALSDTVPPPLAAKQHAAVVSVCDPLDPNNNVAESCTKIPQIRAMFKYCHMALGKWDDSSCDPVTFRGRTPLSTIIAHKALWPRLSKFQIPINPAAK